MYLSLKKKKENKFKAKVLNNKCCLLYSKFNNAKNWLYIDQELKKKNLIYFHLLNTVSTKITSISSFNLYKNIFIGSLLVITSKKQKFSTFFNLQFFLTLNKVFSFLCLKFFNSYYYEVQLKNLVSLNYVNNNIKLFKLIYYSVKFFFFFCSK